MTGHVGPVGAQEPSQAPIRVEYRKGLDLPLAASGVALLLGGALLETDSRTVPPQGLDPSEINLEMDRNVVGHRDANADDASDVLRDVTAAFPLAVRVASAPDGRRLRSTGEGLLLYAESVALAEGLAAVVKKLASRPRPFTYLPEGDRPSHENYDATPDRAFQSFPSGHATFTWCAATLGTTDHLFLRPGASWIGHAGVAFLGSALATTTTALRVEAGQHFPSDVLVGSAIGATSGVVVPLVHRYVAGEARAPGPKAASVRGAAAGLALGIVTGLLLSDAVGAY